MASIYSKAERYKYFLKFLMDKYEPKCYFCETKLDGLAFYRNISKKKMDDISVHHLDENRSNNAISNLVMAHRKCHLKHHREMEKRRMYGRTSFTATAGTEEPGVEKDSVGTLLIS